MKTLCCLGLMVLAGCALNSAPSASPMEDGAVVVLDGGEASPVLMPVHRPSGVIPDAAAPEPADASDAAQPAHDAAVVVVPDAGGTDAAVGQDAAAAFDNCAALGFVDPGTGRFIGGMEKALCKCDGVELLMCGSVWRLTQASGTLTPLPFDCSGSPVATDGVACRTAIIANHDYCCK